MSEETFDLSRRYVRVTNVRPEGLIEFEFAIGEPDLVVEMILTREALQEFCAANAAITLPPKEDSNIEPSDWDWRMKDATHTRFK
ncbi:MAG TPA: phenol hydroxylase subunit [Alicycliphilus sp.]|nr:phenol hydroxylase subunit [Alicycliphilus sp.]